MIDDIAKILAYVIGLIVTIYIAYVLISSLVTVTPGFALIGWVFMIIIILGGILFMLYLFKNIIDF
jgi:hypothetical protein